MSIYEQPPERKGFVARWICRHSVLRVTRWHREVVPPHMQGKQLYVDRFNVHNFIQCDKCGHTFDTNQKAYLFDSQQEFGMSVNDSEAR